MKKRYNQITSINPKVGRNINRAIILNAIRQQQPISRTRISEMTELNKSTVSNIVSTLLAEDLVREEVAKNREIGRNPLDLSIKRGKNFVGAIYIDSVDTTLAIVDIDGTVESKIQIKTEAHHPAEFVTHCLEKLDGLRNQFARHRFRGIGVSVAGIVDALHSKVVFAPNLGWEDLDLGKIIREQAPDVEMIAIENDAKASALAELLLGKNKINPANFVFLSVGTGIGAGIVVDNHVLSGISHAAGEFGHVTILEGGEACSCGNKGCWEVYASDRATIRRYASEKKLSAAEASHVTISEVVEMSKKKESPAESALSKTAQYLGLGIASIIRAFDPEVIVIGGAITQNWNLIYPHIMEAVNRRGFFGQRQNTTILPTSLSDTPPLLGAAALSIRKIFTDYRIAI